MKNKIKYVFYVCIISTIAFIWSQSCLSMEASGNESDAVREMMEKLFGTETAFAQFVSTYIRKIAHFTEFALLGFEMTLFTYVCTKSKINDLFRCLVFGVAVAVTDETIQIFTGRGSSIFDVMIDTSGYIFAFLFASLLYFVIANSVRTIEERKKYKNV